MQIITSPSKIEQVTTILRQEIKQGVYAVGSRLPGIRELAQRFDVSSRIISLAVERLNAENLVVRKHSKGIYVNDWRRSDVFEVYFLHWAKYDIKAGYCRTLMEMIYPPHLRRGFHFTIRSIFDDRLNQEHLIQEIRNISSICGIDCLLMNATGVAPETIRFLRKLTLPVIFLGDFHLEEMTRMNLNQITGDVFRDGYRGVELIGSLGYREMLLLQPLGNYYYRRFHAGAMQAATDFGIKVDPVEIPYAGDYNRADFELAVQTKLQGLDPNKISRLPALCFGLGQDELNAAAGPCRNADSPPWVMPKPESRYLQDYYDAIFDNMEKVIRNHENPGLVMLELPLLLVDVQSGKQWLKVKHWENL